MDRYMYTYIVHIDTRSYYIHVHGWMDGQTDGQMDRRTDRWMDGWMDGWTDTTLYIHVDG